MSCLSFGEFATTGAPLVENGLESATEAEIDSAATSPTAPIPPVPRRGTARGIRAIEGHGFAIAPGFMVENDLPMAAQDDAEGPRLWRWSSPTLQPNSSVTALANADLCSNSHSPTTSGLGYLPGPDEQFGNPMITATDPPGPRPSSPKTRASGRSWGRVRQHNPQMPSAAPGRGVWGADPGLWVGGASRHRYCR